MMIARIMDNCEDWMIRWNRTSFTVKFGTHYGFAIYFNRRKKK